MSLLAARVRWADESDSDEGWLGHENHKPGIRKASLACLVEWQRQCVDAACAPPPVSEPVVAFQTVGVDRISIATAIGVIVTMMSCCFPNGERRCKLVLNP